MQLQPPASISRHKRLSCPSVKPHAQGAAGVCSLRPHLREFGSPRRPRDSVLLRQVPFPHCGLSSALQLILSQHCSQQGHCKDVVVHKPFVYAQSAETKSLLSWLSQAGTWRPDKPPVQAANFQIGPLSAALCRHSHQGPQTGQQRPGLTAWATSTATATAMATPRAWSLCPSPTAMASPAVLPQRTVLSRCAQSHPQSCAPNGPTVPEAQQAMHHAVQVQHTAATPSSAACSETQTPAARPAVGCLLTRREAQ